MDGLREAIFQQFGKGQDEEFRALGVGNVKPALSRIRAGGKQFRPHCHGTVDRLGKRSLRAGQLDPQLILIQLVAVVKMEKKQGHGGCLICSHFAER